MKIARFLAMLTCVISFSGCHTIEKTLGLKDEDKKEQRTVDQWMVSGLTNQDFQTVRSLPLEGNRVEVLVLRPNESSYRALLPIEYELDSDRGRIKFGYRAIENFDGSMILTFEPIAPVGTQYDIYIQNLSGSADILY